MRYNTGNPVGTDGSSDPRDLYDNAGVIDLLMNGPLGEYLSRLGVPLKSWRGIMQQVTDYLIAQGYESVYLTYGAGVVVERQTQLVQRDGELYRVMNAADIPLTLTGTWATDAPKLQAVGDAALRQALAAPGGANLVEYSESTTYNAGTVGDALSKLDGLPDKVDGISSAQDYVVVDALYNGSDETAAYQAAITKAIAEGKRYVKVSGDLLVNGTVTGRGNIIPIGKGKFTSMLGGAYRRPVFPDRHPNLYFPGIRPGQHLVQFSRTATPKVVLMGDSISTYGANSYAQNTMLAGFLEQKIKSDNPTRTVTFVNRAIGGQTFTTANTRPGTPPDLNLYPWYTDPNRDWLLYIQDQAPELLIISFGMNDSGNFNYAALDQMIAKIKAWGKVPDIVFCTNLVPSMEPGSDYMTGYGDRSGQEGRDQVAGYIRNYAERNNYGLIDINRVGNLIRDGFDVRNSHNRLKDVNYNAAANNGYYQCSEACRDFLIRFSITGTSAELAAKFTNSPPMALQLSNHAGDVCFINRTSGGNIQLQLYHDSGALMDTVDTGIPIPTTSIFMAVEVRDNVLRFSTTSADGLVSSTPVVVPKILRYGGVFLPRLYYYGTLTGPATLVTSHVFDDELFRPSLLNDDVWGVGSNTVGTKIPYGGNGLNHPTSVGAVAIYSAAVGAANFNQIQPYTIPALAPGGAMVVAANDAGALTAGVPIGGLYRTATGEVRCRIA
ncbi:SGNH/GDSL hydrolase family protein [Pseudomonas sp. p1(2021b)]|uniref:SGNH/GDSL hydrolase family protein n=1 Tax=Pseudomonas sp. p1(2021b) TaxID=2874628 RepID=UPI003D273A36